MTEKIELSLRLQGLRERLWHLRSQEVDEAKLAGLVKEIERIESIFDEQ